MMDPTQLAAEAMKLFALAAPAAKLMAGKAEENLAAEGSKKLLTWLTGKLSAPAPKAALDRAIADPEKPRNLASLENEIAALAEDDPDFRRELERHLGAAGVKVTHQTQTATATGNNNRQTQIIGSGNAAS